MSTNLNLASIKTSAGSISRTLGARFQDTYNVKDFGAKGDGVTDDRTAIQTVVDLIANVVYSSAPAGTLYFPSGTYIIGSPGIVLNNTSVQIAIEFMGDGYSTCLSGDFTGYVIDRSTASGGAANITIENMRVMNSHSGADGGAIRLTSTTNSAVRDCLIQATGIGLNLLEAVYTPAIEACTISSLGYFGS